jgi:hypothetical protein
MHTGAPLTAPSASPKTADGLRYNPAQHSLPPSPSMAHIPLPHIPCTTPMKGCPAVAESHMLPTVPSAPPVFIVEQSHLRNGSCAWVGVQIHVGVLDPGRCSCIRLIPTWLGCHSSGRCSPLRSETHPRVRLAGPRCIQGLCLGGALYSLATCGPPAGLPAAGPLCALWLLGSPGTACCQGASNTPCSSPPSVS